MPAARCREQLSYWRAALSDVPEQIELPFDRSRPAVSSHRGGSVPLVLDGVVAWRAAAAFARRRGEPVHGAAGRCCGAAEPSGSGPRHRDRQPDCGPRRGCAGGAGRVLRQHAGAAHRRVGQSRGLRELLGRVRAGNLVAYSHQDVPFERLVEVLNPQRSLSRHPLFQVMLAFQSQGVPALELSGLSVRAEPVATASAKFDLSVSVSEQRAADGAPLGIVGVLEYASDLFERGSVAVSGRAAGPAAVGGGGGPRARGRGRLGSCRRPSARHCWRAGTHRAAGFGAKPAGAVCGAGRPHAGGGRADVRGAAAELRGARVRTPTAWRITCAAWGWGRRPWWGFAWSARRRW